MREAAVEWTSRILGFLLGIQFRALTIVARTHMAPLIRWRELHLTPNDDGTNDYFFPVFRGVREMVFIITDRWGNILFRTDDMDSEGWDGTFNGESEPQGVYNWYVELRYRTGKHHDDHGSIYLLR